MRILGVNILAVNILVVNGVLATLYSVKKCLIIIYIQDSVKKKIGSVLRTLLPKGLLFRVVV